MQNQKSYAESSKLHNLFFVACIWRSFELARGDEGRPDSGRLRRQRGSPQAWRPCIGTQSSVLQPRDWMGLRTAGFSLL